MKRDEITKIALEIIDENGLINLTRKYLCERANIPSGSFPNVMGCNFTEFLENIKLYGHLYQNRKPINRVRTNPYFRKKQILETALELSKKSNYLKITMKDIAAKAEISHGLISKYFKTMDKLRCEIMKYSIENEVIEIVAQGLTSGNKYAKKAPQELKIKASELLAGL